MCETESLKYSDLIKDLFLMTRIINRSTPERFEKLRLGITLMWGPNPLGVCDLVLVSKHTISRQIFKLKGNLLSGEILAHSSASKKGVLRCFWGIVYAFLSWAKDQPGCSWRWTASCFVLVAFRSLFKPSTLQLAAFNAH